MISWGTASGFNMGRIEGTDVRVERGKSHGSNLWTFMLSNDSLTYLHVDDREFVTLSEMESAIMQWIVERGKNDVRLEDRKRR
jgi:hypothetical protein